jgi:hypothetical protein
VTACDPTWFLFDEAVRGFFFEKRLPWEQADEWTEEIVKIATEHLLSPRDKDSQPDGEDSL